MSPSSAEPPTGRIERNLRHSTASNRSYCKRPRGFDLVASRGRWWSAPPPPAAAVGIIARAIMQQRGLASISLSLSLAPPLAASAAVPPSPPPPPSGVRSLEDVEQHRPALPFRLRPEPPAHLPGGLGRGRRGPLVVLTPPRAVNPPKVELSRSLAFSCQRVVGGGRLRLARRRGDRERRCRCGACRGRGRRRRRRGRALSLLDDLLLAVDPPSPSPQLDHGSPARGLRENDLKWGKVC